MILELLGSAGFGSALGALFGYLNKKEERKTIQMKLDHEKNMIEAKTNAQLKLGELEIDAIQTEADAKVQALEARAFERSQKTLSNFAASAKAVIRPLILLALLYQTYIILDSLEQLTGGLESLPQADVLALYKIVILMITGLTATAVSWYFAARSSKQFDKLVDKWV